MIKDSPSCLVCFFHMTLEFWLTLIDMSLLYYVDVAGLILINIACLILMNIVD